MNKDNFLLGLKVKLKENGFSNVDELLNEFNGMGVFENNNWFCNCSDCLVDDIILDEVDCIIEEYCKDNNIGFIV